MVWVTMCDENMAYREDVFSKTEEPPSAGVYEDSITLTKINEEAGPTSFDGGNK